jgi:hypothetical protein
LDPNPIIDQDKYINDLRIKYRTYYVEYNVNEVSLTFNYYLIRFIKHFLNLIFVTLFFILFFSFYDVVKLPKMFAVDFGNQINRYANLVDPKISVIDEDGEDTNKTSNVYKEVFHNIS